LLGLRVPKIMEIIESDFHKFKLIGDAEAEHWSEFRENLDKLTVSFVVAGTDDDSPHSVDEVLPLFGQMLSQLCEAFERVYLSWKTTNHQNRYEKARPVRA
jgi:hypothetical protein